MSEKIANIKDELAFKRKNVYHSLTDDQKVLGAPRDFTMHVSDVRWSSEARFVVFLMGKIMTMPGLSKEPAYLGMKFSNSGKISGLY